MNQKLQQEVLRNFNFLPDNSLVRLPTLMALYGLSKSTILREIKRGNLPKYNVDMDSRYTPRYGCGCKVHNKVHAVTVSILVLVAA